MSRLNRERKDGLLKELALGVKSNEELSKQFGVTVVYCDELRQTVESCMKMKYFTHETITTEIFRKALVPLEVLAKELLIAGMSIKQVQKITKLSASILKHFKENYREEIGDQSAIAIYRQGLEGKIMCSTFAINYAPFASDKPVDIIDVLIALRLAYRQIQNLFPKEEDYLQLREAYEIAEDLNSGKREDGSYRKFVLDVCPKCSLPFLQYEASYRPRQQCPFCELNKQIKSKQSLTKTAQNLQALENSLLDKAKETDSEVKTAEGANHA